MTPMRISSALLTCTQKVYDIIHPSRRDLTAIRGCARLDGLPGNLRTGPRDRVWFTIG
ncbi:hypothetical protein BD779DRAFT_1508862 [Infundibulicybe gibba]|nr:hypothetical protein BD779DRAFT_1508862 [Infundibulicybe gibba]